MPTVLRDGPYSFTFFSSDRGEPPHIQWYNTKQLSLRHGMTTLVLETEPIAVHVTVTEDKLTVDLADGRSLVVPLAWYPRLVQGAPAERQHWQLLGDGYAIEWLDLDEHIGV